MRREGTWLIFLYPHSKIAAIMIRPVALSLGIAQRVSPSSALRVPSRRNLRTSRMTAAAATATATTERLGAFHAVIVAAPCLVVGRTVATPVSPSAAAVAFAARLSSDTRRGWSTGSAAAAATILSTISALGCVASCEEPRLRRPSLLRRKTEPAVPHPGAAPKPASAGTGDIFDEAPTLEELPVYRTSDVAQNDGRGGNPIWMSYGGVVYDVTGFVPNHPGGTEKILMASGSAIEPFWNIYRQHFSSDLPMRMMEQMIIGRLHEDDQAVVDAAMEREMDNEHNPYVDEPMRHPALIIHNDQPMNAETPSEMLTASYLTPADLFFVRNHHPVPNLDKEDVRDYAVHIDLSALGRGSMDISLDNLKTQFPKVEITATIQCSGNRRADFNKHKRTSGTPWGQGAISTAQWGGVRLIDVLRHAGMDESASSVVDKHRVEHVIFESHDEMVSSIDAQKALGPYGDVMLAYEMNGKPLTRDHGYPLRLIVPGYTAVRSVKWLSRIELSREAAEGPWQRGLNYKVLPPEVEDANVVNLEDTPSVMESSVYSGVSGVERVRDLSAAGGEGHRRVGRKITPRKGKALFAKQKNDKEEGEAGILRPGDWVKVRASGWAWSGGGRNIARVDVTGDDGESWTTASLLKGGNQRFGRAWAWVFWTADVPAIVGEDGSTVEVSSKAVDVAFNVQPEHCNSSWNVRGLGNNSWYRATAKVP